MKGSERVAAIRWWWRKVRVLLAVYWAFGLEYRAVIFVWILSTTIPLVMMAVWVRLAAGGSVGGYTPGDFIAYYLANMLVMHLVSTWHGLELSRNIRSGEINPHLLKPFHPLWHYGLRALPTKPLRLPIYLPPMVLIAWWRPDVSYNVHPVALLAFLASMAIAYALTFFMQTSLALLAFWISHAEPLVLVWYHLRLLFSGYVVPLALFPPDILRVVWWLPFRFTLSVPLEILTGKLPAEAWGPALLVGLLWTAGFFALTQVLWQRGLRVYAAYGA